MINIDFVLKYNCQPFSYISVLSPFYYSPFFFLYLSFLSLTFLTSDLYSSSNTGFVFLLSYTTTLLGAYLGFLPPPTSAK